MPVASRRPLPPAARVTVAAVCAAGVMCGAPALRPGTHWTTLAVLAVLYALCEPGVLPARLAGRHPPSAVGPFLPVLLAGALLLPPAAAALVGVPGSLAGRPAPWVRRCWRAGYLAVAAWVAALCGRAVGGPGAMRAAGLPYGLLPAFCAALCFCVTATALTGAVLVTAEQHPPAAAWAEPLLGALVPHLTYGLVALMTALLWLRGYGVFAAVLVPLPMYVACWVFARSRRERAAHGATVRALVHAVDLKDPYTRGHSERVGRASALIARELGLPEERVDALRLAGLLHDIGKLGVPTRVLRKKGPLTEEERRVIQLHPEYGHDMTRGIAFLGEAREAILHHHERLDGTGYPHGLSGDGIPQCARVVAVADAFDAMTSTRSYRPARPADSALAELRHCAGTHFDPAVVEALCRALTPPTPPDPAHPATPERSPDQAPAAAPTPAPARAAVPAAADGAADGAGPGYGWDPAPGPAPAGAQDVPPGRGTPSAGPPGRPPEPASARAPATPTASVASVAAGGAAAPAAVAWSVVPAPGPAYGWGLVRGSACAGGADAVPGSASGVVGGSVVPAAVGATVVGEGTWRLG